MPDSELPPHDAVPSLLIPETWKGLWIRSRPTEMSPSRCSTSILPFNLLNDFNISVLLEDIARRKGRSLVLSSHKVKGRIIYGHSEPGGTGKRQNSLEKPNRRCEAEEPCVQRDSGGKCSGRMVMRLENNLEAQMRDQGGKLCPMPRSSRFVL